MARSNGRNKKRRARRRAYLGLMAPSGKAFPIYGKYCGPGYGDIQDSPIDAIDSACQAHDEEVGLGVVNADERFDERLRLEGGWKAGALRYGYRLLSGVWNAPWTRHDDVL